MTEYKVRFNEAHDELEAVEVIHCTDGSTVTRLVATGDRAKEYRDRGCEEYGY